MSLRSPGRTRKTSVGRSAGRELAGGLAGTAGGRPIAGTSSTSTNATGITATRRAYHILGGDDRLILDIGARITKVGHCGEARPRAIVRSLDHATTAEQAKDDTCQGVLFTLDVARCRDETQRRVNEYKLKARLKTVLRSMIHQVLTQDAKQRKCVIVENPFMPTLVKELMREILFDNLYVASVLFVNSHLMSAVAIGRLSTMVVDVGYEQTTLVPVHLWRPMIAPYAFTTPRASKRLSQRLKALLLHFGTYIAPAHTTLPSTSGTSTFAYLQQSAAGSSSALPDRTKIPAEILDEDFLDEIKAKALLVPSISPDGQPEHELHGETMQQLDDELFDEEATNEAWLASIRKSYGRNCKTKDLVINVPPTPVASLTPASQPATLGGASTAQRAYRGCIIVPGFVRERAAEVLFEQGDEDALSLTELILEALLKLPVDVRSILAGNVYIVGGAAMLPGLAHRLRLELVRTLQRAGKHANHEDPTLLALTRPTVGHLPERRALQAIVPPQIGSTNEHDKAAKGSYSSAAMDAVESSDADDETFQSAMAEGEESFTTTAEGDTAKLAHATTTTTTKMTTKSQTIPKSHTRFTPLSSLVELVAVINDHAPRLNLEGHPTSGHAPSFPVNVSAWIGASLMGSLRVDAVDQMSKEQWEESQERARRKAHSARQNESTGERPSMGLGRGSFLGTVGGLDLGTYGPLSAGARNKFAGASPSASNLRSPTTHSAAGGEPRSPPSASNAPPPQGA